MTMTYTESQTTPYYGTFSESTYVLSILKVDLDIDCDRDADIDDDDDALEEDPGAFVRINLDDNNLNYNPDKDDTAVPDENDLEKIGVLLEPWPIETGSIVLSRNNEHARVWNDPEKGSGNEILVGSNEKVWDLTQAGDRTDFANAKDNLWVEGYSKGITELVLSFRDNSGNDVCSDLNSITVDTGRVYIAFGYCPEPDIPPAQQEEQQDWLETEMLDKMFGMIAQIEAKGYEVPVLSRCSIAQCITLLEDVRTIGVIWASHGWIQCAPAGSSCQHVVSRNWSWEAGATPPRAKIWLDDWTTRLEQKKLHALWMLNCGGKDPGGVPYGYHWACDSCANCGCDICALHNWATRDTSCTVCMNGYQVGGVTMFHSVANPPSNLQTFESEKDTMRRSGGFFMTYEYSTLPDAVEDVMLQAGFRDALP